jgi:hypothetical protein
MSININSWRVILTSFVFVAVACYVLFSYASSEIISIIHLGKFDVVSVCLSDEKPDFKYAKLVKYENYKGTAEIYCVYSDSQKNQIVGLNYLNQWRVVQRKNLSARFSWYFPVYF